MKLFLASIASVITVIVVGLALERAYAVNLVDRHSLMALAWLAIGPSLWFDAIRMARNFLESYRAHFPTEKDYAELRRAFERWMSTGRWIFCVAWAGLATWLVSTLVYPQAVGLARVWVVVSFGTLFLVSGSGFWGVGAMILLVRRFSSTGVHFQPYHPDQFGGLGAVGTFAVRGALYFSSGALVLPLAFHAVGLARRANDPSLSVLAYLVTALFIVGVIVAFAAPVLEIKRLGDRERIRVTEEARLKLEGLMERYRAKPDHDEHLARQIEFCHTMECGELAKLREYPYDVKVITELLVALAFPVGLVILETLLRT